MNLVLLEDEDIAMRKLRRMLLEADRTITIIAELSSVEEANAWFRQKAALQRIDLICADIQLSDGLSFEVFAAAGVQVPIIFTTAYNEYAIEAFRVNSIEYLLKPIAKEDMTRALAKFRTNTTHYSSEQFRELERVLIQLQARPNHQIEAMPSFLAVSGSRIIPLRAESIEYFFVQHQIVKAMHTTHHEYRLDETLEEIEKRLPKREFFRANRQYIIARRAVQEAEFYFGNRLLVHLQPPAPEAVVISREKVSVFRAWLQGEVN